MPLVYAYAHISYSQWLSKKKINRVLFSVPHTSAGKLRPLYKHWCDSSVLVRAECLRCDCNCCCVDVSHRGVTPVHTSVFCSPRSRRGLYIASFQKTWEGDSVRKHPAPEADDWWGSVAMATGTTHAAAPFARAGARVNTERRSFRMFQRQRVKKKKKKKKKKQPSRGTLCPACPSSPRLKPETQTLQMNPQRRKHTRRESEVCHWFRSGSILLQTCLTHSQEWATRHTSASRDTAARPAADRRWSRHLKHLTESLSRGVSALLSFAEWREAGEVSERRSDRGYRPHMTAHTSAGSQKIQYYIVFTVN